MIAEPALRWKKKPVKTGISIKKVAILRARFVKFYRLRQNRVCYSYHG